MSWCTGLYLWASQWHQFKATGLESVGGTRGVINLAICSKLQPNNFLKDTRQLSIVGWKSPVYCQPATLDHWKNCPVWSLSRNPTAHGASRDGQCVSALTKKRYFKLETVNSKRVFPEFIQIIEFPVMQRSFSMTTVERQRSKGHITGWRRLHYSKSSWQKRVRLTDASFCFLDHLPGARPPSLTSPWGCTALLCCWCFLPITSLQSFWTPFELLQSFTVKSISEADRHGRLKPTQWFYEDKENRAPACFSLYSSRR